jgi:hypothetical protein
VARDVRDAVLTLARYAPRLPGIAEKFVLAADQEATRPAPPPRPPGPLALVAAGLIGGLAAAAALLALGAAP